MGACGEGLGDVSRVADAAVGDDRHPAFGGPGGVVDGGDLGNPDAADDPGRADRPWANAHLYRIGAGVDQGPGSLDRRHIAGDDLDGEVPLDAADRVDHVLAVSVGGVDHDQVNIGLDQRGDPLEVMHANGRANPEPPSGILAG